MRKAFHNLSISKKTLLLLTLYVLIPAIFLFVIAVFYLNNRENKNAMDKMVQAMENTETIMENYFANIAHVADTIGRDTRTVDILKGKKDVNYYGFLYDLKEDLLYIPSIVKIQILDQDKILQQIGNERSGYAFDGEENDGIYEKMNQENKYEHWSEWHLGHVLEAGSFEKEIMLTSYYRQIMDSQGKSCGIMAIHISESGMAELYRGIGEDYKIWVLNEDREVMSASDWEENEAPPEALITLGQSSSKGYSLGKGFHEGQLYAWGTLKESGLQVLMLREISFLYPQMALFLLAFIVLFTFFCLIYVYANHRYVIRPLRKLSEQVVRGEKLEIQEDRLPDYNDEIGVLSRSFRQMIARIHSLIDTIYVEKIKTQEAEQIALLAQINPHFLYNTLDSIKWNAMKNKDRDVALQLEALAVMLRGTLNFGEKYSTIETEMSIIENYCYLIQARFRKDIEVKIEKLPEVSGLKIPKLIIQPLVENAFKHGLENKLGEKHMWIKIRRNGNRLVIYVADDGLGCDEKAVMEKVHDKDAPASECFALRNVYERLLLFYGKEARFQFHSKPRKGTFVKLYLPINRVEEMEEQGPRGFRMF